MKDFREKLRDRLHAQMENERWNLLLRQKTLIAEYERLADELRKSDAQIQRLLGPPPGKDICPDCYYRSGSVVSLRPLSEGNRADDSVVTCPTCDLVFTPE